MQPLLEVRDLDVHYGAIHALKGVSLTVEAGQIVTLLGSNGAGKTTTLRALSGLIQPTAGSITFDGRALTRLPAHAIVRLGIAHAPEGRGIFANLTVLDNLELGAYARHDRTEVSHDLERELERFPILKERARQPAGTLSGGEQQMLAVSRALMARPRLLLLDEPSLGLAPQVVQTLFRCTQEIQKNGVTILLVEQNAHMALSIADYAYVLETGRVKMSDTAARLQGSDEIRRSYLGVS